MYILDTHDPKKGLGLRLGQELHGSDQLRRITEMLLLERTREEPLGVVGELTGTFFWKPDDLSVLAISKVDKLRWGRGASE